jgi:transaldolase
LIKIKFFIDSGKIEEIERVKSYGLLDGVTTNPSLIKKAVESEKQKGRVVDMEKYIKEMILIAKGLPVSLEVIGTTYEEMVSEGRKLYEKFNPIADNVYVKIPASPSTEENNENNFDGIKAIKELTGMNIRVNCTLVFTPEQALSASKAGARFVSPFTGRVDDYIRFKNKVQFDKSDYFPGSGIEKSSGILEDNGITSGVDLVEQIVITFDNYDIRHTEVLAASIRNTRQLREVALAGADIATIPMDVFEKMVSHYKTMEGMRKFIEDIVPEYSSIFKD